MIDSRRLALPKLAEIGAAGSAAPALDAETQRRLHELGYVVGPEVISQKAR